MELTVDSVNDKTIVSVAGRLDAITSKIFEDRLLQLIDEGKTKLVLDFSALDYISSAGLRGVLSANRTLAGTSGKIVIASMKPSVKEIFDIAGFTQLFSTAPSRDEALQQL